MNKQVAQEIQRRLTDKAQQDMVVLRKKLVSMMGSGNNKRPCKDPECLKEIDTMVGEVMEFLAGIALSHDIAGHDLIDEVLTCMLEGNKAARVATQTIKAFKDDKHVGIC